jgi:hypothetical protein
VFEGSHESPSVEPVRPEGSVESPSVEPVNCRNLVCDLIVTGIIVKEQILHDTPILKSTRLLNEINHRMNSKEKWHITVHKIKKVIRCS